MSSSSSQLIAYPNQFIRAGAGAGKTTRLVSTFIDFVIKFKAIHNRYPKVILTTFTRKSTQEIKERLLKQALKLNDTELFAYINKKSSVHISTIHGVLSLFLNQYQDIVGLSTDFKVLDKEQIRKQNFKELKTIFKNNTEFVELLDHYSFKDLLEHLDKAFEFSNQHEQINFIKNTDLFALRKKEFKYMIALIETLTELPKPEGKGWAEYFAILGHIGQALKVDDLDLALQILATLPNKPRFSKDKPPFETELHDEMQKYFTAEQSILEQLDTDAYIAENYRINQLFFNLLNLFSQKIKDARTLKNEITISDLETLSLEVIRISKTAARQFSSEFDYFMVDEFQDTSPTQLNILKALIGDRPHFIVGDPQQSIYLFRGARSEVFLSKQEEALRGNYENIRLNTNYRSRPSLMHFMNQFFSDFSSVFEPMIPKTEEQSVPKDFFEGTYIQAQDEINATLRHIQKLLLSGAKASEICVLSKKNATLMMLSQVATKYNIAVQLMVAAGFDDRREILDLVSFVRFLVNPYDSENLVQLLRSPWFTMTDNDIVRLRQKKSDSVNNNNHFWIQLKAANHIDAQTLSDCLKHYFEFGILETTIHFIKNSGILSSCQYLDATGKKEANIWKFIQSLRDQVNHKSFHLNEYLTFQFSSLQSDLASNLSEAQPVVSPDRVNLMTIHNAKGLQFEHVIVMGMKDQPNTTNVMPLAKDEALGLINLGLFSTDDSQIRNSYWGVQQRRLFNQREHAESERLLYVAVTRAIISVTFVAEDKQKNFKTNWFSKSAWPELGEYKTEKYAYQSIRDDFEPEIVLAHQAGQFSVTEPYKKIELAQSETESVTEIISKNKFSKNVEVANNFLKNLDKAKAGTDLHRFFEALKYNTLAEVQNLTTEKNKTYLNYLLQQTDLPLEAIIKTGFVEWGFGLKNDSKTIQGQIDAWGTIEDTVYVLDYKTGTSDYIDSAYQQLEFYATCLKLMGKIKAQQKIILGVIYPIEKKIFKKEILFADLIIK